MPSQGDDGASFLRKRPNRLGEGYCLRALYIVFIAAALASAAWTANMLSSTMSKKRTVPADASGTVKPKGFGANFNSFISGGVGGICVVIVGHPLDLIKVRMQTSQATSESMLQILSRTFNESGIRGMYRGVSAPLLASAFVFAVSFWGYSVGQQIVRYVTNHTDLSIVELCLAGGLSGIPSALLLAPFERIKVLMQTEAKYTSMFQCGFDVIREGGVSSLFRGTILTLVRDVPGSMSWYGTYEYIKYSALLYLGYSSPSQLPSIVILVAGGLAGMVCWTISMPADVLKSRLQSAPEGTYAGAMDVFREVTHAEGLQGLFKGLVPALMRAFPANAACFFGMEVTQKLLTFLESMLFAR